MKPSEINHITAKKAHLLPKHFQAITWMGTIYCNRNEDVDSINNSANIDSKLKCHETIHVRQAQAMNDSWLKFYLNYVIQYIKNIPLILIDTYAPYRLIPTEIEAYLNEDNYNYPQPQQPLTAWKTFQKLTLKRKREIARLYQQLKPRRTFTYALKQYFKEGK